MKVITEPLKIVRTSTTDKKYDNKDYTFYNVFCFTQDNYTANFSVTPELYDKISKFVGQDVFVRFECVYGIATKKFWVTDIVTGNKW